MERSAAGAAGAAAAAQLAQQSAAQLAASYIYGSARLSRRRGSLASLAVDLVLEELLLHV